MAILLTATRIRKAFAARPLFDAISFTLETGDRIGLIGPNGAGKSTLLRILAAESTVDQGEISLQRGLRIGFLQQVPEFQAGTTVLSAVQEGANPPKDANDWESQTHVEEIISRLGFQDPHTPVESLSGGWKKRVALGRELAKKPDLLLLDEPTNHLDVGGILWLEKFLASAPFATLTITHDRLFLQRISNKIWELDRRNAQGLLVVKGDYATYLEIKEQMIASQERREVVLKNTLRRETEWLRRGAKARTTKQSARIQRTHELEQTVSELSDRNLSRASRLDFQAAERNPKKLIEAQRISKRYGEHVLFSDFNLLISPGRRIGILGANGSGKSTLIRVLLGLEPSDSGSLFRSDQLKVSYFEQNRESLDPQVTVAKTLCPHGDYVEDRGNRVHIRSYLDRFLFTPGQMEMAVGKLSGGEQSRLLLARLMLQEASLLILDEPTNDLDLATLTLLEDCLLQFSGAILLVTHDRYFLDQVANQILAIPAPYSASAGTLLSFASFEQWEAWSVEEQGEEKKWAQAQKKQAKINAQPQGAGAPAAAAAHLTSGGTTTKNPSFKKKRSFKDQHELDAIEQSLPRLESELEDLSAQLDDPQIASQAAQLLKITTRSAEVQLEIERLYGRWAELEQKA